MSIIYKPKGRAAEYSPLAVNLYNGCSHGCKYCYVPGAVFREREDFYKNVYPRKNVIERLRAEVKPAATIKGYKVWSEDPVLLCFTCDPYQPANDKHGLARKAIEILKAYDYPVTILSKAGLKMTQDYDLLGPEDSAAVTLTFLSETKSRKWEPNAARPIDRIHALEVAKDAGLKTWASIEPVIDPAESLEIMREAATWVDLFKIGTLNHSKAAHDTDWRDFMNRAVDLCLTLGKEYFIKKDLSLRAQSSKI